MKNNLHYESSPRSHRVGVAFSDLFGDSGSKKESILIITETNFVATKLLQNPIRYQHGLTRF